MCDFGWHPALPGPRRLPVPPPAVPSHSPVLPGASHKVATHLSTVRALVLGRARHLVWMGWVTSGRPWPLSGCRVPTHGFINFPKVLPFSGRFSQRPRHLWARLCAACWMASRHGPGPSRDVPSVTASSLLHPASAPRGTQDERKLRPREMAQLSSNGPAQPRTTHLESPSRPSKAQCQDVGVSQPRSPRHSPQTGPGV